MRLFDHGRTCTLWLNPSSSKELSQLQGKLLKAFPDCTDLSEDPSRGITEFTPHLSLGQWQGSKAAQAAQQVLLPGSLLLQVQVARLQKSGNAYSSSERCR